MKQARLQLTKICNISDQRDLRPIPRADSRVSFTNTQALCISKQANRIRLKLLLLENFPQPQQPINLNQGKNVMIVFKKAIQDMLNKNFQTLKLKCLSLLSIVLNGVSIENNTHSRLYHACPCVRLCSSIEKLGQEDSPRLGKNAIKGQGDHSCLIFIGFNPCFDEK